MKHILLNKNIRPSLKELIVWLKNFEIKTLMNNEHNQLLVDLPNGNSRLFKTSSESVGKNFVMSLEKFLIDNEIIKIT